MSDDIVKRLRAADGTMAITTLLDLCTEAAYVIEHHRTELAKRDAELARLNEPQQLPPGMEEALKGGEKIASEFSKPIIDHVSGDSMIDRAAKAIHEGRMSAAAKFGIQPGDDLEAIKRKIRGGK